MQIRLIPMVTLMAGALCAASASAGVIASDSFAGTAGTSINGRTTETGNLTWTADTPYVLSSDGNVQTTVNAGSLLATVPLTVSAGETVIVQARVKPMSTNSADWIGIGFMGATGTQPQNAGQPWTLLRTTGGMQFFPSGVTGVVNASASNFISGGFNVLTLEYNSATNKATVSVNGLAVSNLTNISLGTVTPAIARVGFSFNTTGASESARGALDDFAFGTAPLPEPASVSLLGLGGLALLKRRRKGARA